MLSAAMLFGWGLHNASAGMSKLEAISMIETGNNDRAVGGAGEISRYQIKPYIWRQYSKSLAYANVTIASWVAERHLEFLERAFRVKTGREASDFDIYVMWNGGFSYYQRHGFRPSAVKGLIRERASRYVNLRTEEPVLVAKPAMVAMVDRKQL